MSPHDQSRSPWHAGELALQQSIGVAERMAEIGPRVIRPFLTEQHRQFYPLLPFVVLGSVDRHGWPWATVRAGRSGFLRAPDPRQLDVAVPADLADPAEDGIENGATIGLLGIDLATRRRNRLNGRVVRKGADGFSVIVRQSFGNCPQYIRRRTFAFSRAPEEPSFVPGRRLDRLDDRAREMIRSSDGFFVASYARAEDGEMQVDVSHRGGRPGFVVLGAAGELTIPDYPGNRYFASLGNMLLTRRAGLAFVDFATGDLLQITGEAAVILDPAEAAGVGGAERLWRVWPHRIVHRPQALPIHWTPIPGPASEDD